MIPVARGTVFDFWESGMYFAPHYTRTRRNLQVNAVRNSRPSRGRRGCQLFTVIYEDDDEEEMKISELKNILLYPDAPAASESTTKSATGTRTTIPIGSMG